MLQFVFGPAASGKTTTIHNMISQDITNNKKDILLLVPEQNTFETEKQMLSLFGGGFMSMVSVLSFTRMCETAGQLYGGIAGIRVDDSQRIILMARAVKKVAPHLTYFRKFISSPTFIKQLTSVIGEFKTAGVGSDKLMKISLEAENKNLSLKLSEIAMVYAAYDNLLKGVYIDPLDELEAFCDKALKNNYFDGKTIYIDAFKGFTGQQMKVLKLIIRHCDKVVISLCCEGEDRHEGVGVFSNIVATAERLKEYARTDNIVIEKPIILKNSYFNYPEIKALERILSCDGQNSYDGEANAVNIKSFENPLKEIEYVFKTIHRLVRNSNYRFSDFVIIARDISRYERRISLASQKYNVPCYLDKRRGLISSPVTKFVLSLLKAARNFDTENVLSLLKIGFFEFTDEEINLIEEYVFIWDIRGNNWQNEWAMNPDGFIAKNKKSNSSKSDECLKKINDIRAKIVDPIMNIRKSFSDGASAISKALYDTIIRLKADATVKAICEDLLKNNGADHADFIMDSWDVVMTQLDNMVRCYSGEEISIDEYIDMLELSFINCTVGTIPRMIDEVSCGSADRIRPARPKVVFVIGMNLGEFPANANDSGVLLRSDRILLDKMGVDISDRFRKFAVDEKFLVYSAICCASDSVYILRHSASFSGEALEESPAFTKIKNAFVSYKNSNQNVGEQMAYDNLFPETLEEGFELYASENKSGTPMSIELGRILASHPDYQSRATAIKNSALKTERRVSSDKMHQRLEERFSISASKIEKYNNCPFSYFCEYVLGIKKLQKAELDNLQRGTIVHYVLEKVLSKLGKNIATEDLIEVDKLIDKVMREYLELINGFEYLESERFLFTYNEIGRMLKYLIRHIADEFKSCEFQPEAFELDINDDGEDIPSLRIKFATDKEALLVGQIDRVDVYRDSEGKDFVRIIDYKTGEKTFAISDVLYGLNLQMLVYLYALKKISGTKYSNMESAGILYLPSKRGMETKSKKTGHNMMNGMLVDNDDVIGAMDRNKSGEFVFKKGKPDRLENPVISKEDFDTVLDFVELKLGQTAERIYSGNFDLEPRNGENSEACKYCNFRCVCGIEEDFGFLKTDVRRPSEVIEKMKEAVKSELD